MDIKHHEAINVLTFNYVASRPHKNISLNLFLDEHPEYRDVEPVVIALDSQGKTFNPSKFWIQKTSRMVIDVTSNDDRLIGNVVVRLAL